MTLNMLSTTKLCAAALVVAGSLFSDVRAYEDKTTQYDYIIVGGGTSGLTVANRLTENGKKTVLVVELGDLSSDPSILIPIETYRSHPERMYNITSLPQAWLANRTSGVAAGAVVGGGSAVNGMFFDRGSAADYDAWEKLGNPGWGWDGILPYFRKSVTFTPPEPEIAKRYNYSWDIPSAYGGKGPVQVSFPNWQFPALSLFWKAWEQLGIKKQKDGANGNAFDTFQAPSALDPVTKTRSYARTAHYDPYKNRANYKLLTGYQVTEVRLDGDRAVGVNIVKRGTTGPKTAIKARKEVILAAGAIWTPWLLQRSGIGPKAVLKAAGIPVVKDVPGVGANFQDHPTIFGAWNLTNQPFPAPGIFFANETFMAEAKKEYEEKRSGPYTLARGNQAGFLPLKTVNPQWEKIIKDLLAQDAKAFLPASYDAKLIKGYIAQRNVTADLFRRTDNGVFEYPFSGGPVGGGSLQRTFSRGLVNIDPKNPLGPPLVDYQTGRNPIDIANAIAMVKYARIVMAQEALKELGPVELPPLANVTADAEIEKLLRQALMGPSFAHPSGTASMLPEEFGGVVRSDLRVYGFKGLSVVDASVIPLVPATHICTTVYAVAEKVSLFIHMLLGGLWEY
ncbi:choline dehydrogenase [Dendryphion nanum]|uniref:Choline dehydrogenase n=1 Tax=Dendryphion nanum TaxID=256645 RepID=A0A9P9IJJ0_9PLEO|nr:choline dehydrogenase [Dendryphion nanum]